MNKILLIVPQDINDTNFKAGGQITAANGLRDELAARVDLSVKVVNTLPDDYLSISFFGRVVWSIQLTVAIHNILRTHEIDCVILFVSSPSSVLGRYLVSISAKFYRSKVVFFFRNSSLPNLSRGVLIHRIIGYLFLPIDNILVQGTSFAKYLIQIGCPANKISVVPNWIPPTFNVAKQSIKLNNDDVVKFVFVARFVKSKGVYDICKALEMLAKKYKNNYEFNFVGDGPDLNVVQKVASKGTMGRVQFYGWLDKNDIKKVLGASHVFVLPTYHPEGFPNSILEAMSFGLPVISTDIGAITDSVVDGANGFIVPSKSPRYIASAMEQYIVDHGLLTQHSRRSIDVVIERHDRKLNCNKIIDFICGSIK